jgi:phosphoglycolate phosphatase
MNLLFDLDGTLADPFKAFSSSMNDACIRLGLNCFDTRTLRSLIGPPLHLELARLWGENQTERIGQFMRTYREHHAKEGIYQYEFYPGMDEALQRLAREHRLFVATSKPKVYADEIFRHFCKSHYFEFIYGSELSGVNSKKGDLIGLAMHENKLSPKDTFMIGDRKHDLIGANENGIPGIGVTWGYGSTDELASAGAREIVTTWDQLVQLF